MKYLLNIAGVCIELSTETEVAPGDAFLPFMTSSGAAQIKAQFTPVDELTPITGEAVAVQPCCKIHIDGNGRFLRSIYREPEDTQPYALGWRDDGVYKVEYLRHSGDCVDEMGKLFTHLGLEALMLEQGRMILHASCVNTEYGGLLFSGVSGIGKSTQARLWCSLRGARQINGDRPILGQINGSWRAWGSPYAGSSGCHVNESCSVRAVVLLRQAPQCTLRRLTVGQAFRGLYSGITVNSWDRTFVEKVLELAGQMAQQLPVYELSCTPDERAVEILEQELRKGWGNGAKSAADAASISQSGSGFDSPERNL